jgi:hypothetical protein
VSVTVVSVVGTTVTLNTTGAAGKTITISYVYQTVVSYLRVEKFLGAPDDVASSQLTSAFPGKWTSAHTFPGMCYVHLTLRGNPDVFRSGLPNIKCLVRGRKVYDPRNATTAWSDNAALCMLNYHLDTTYGLMYALSDVVAADWATEANICDEMVMIAIDGQVLGDGTTVGVSSSGQAKKFADYYAAAQPLGMVTKVGAQYRQRRYTINGVATVDQEPRAILSDMLAAAAAVPTRAGGHPAIRCGAYRAPAISLTEKDFRGPIRYQARRARRDSVNQVRGRYMDARAQYQEADFPPVVNATYKTQDGGTDYAADLRLVFVRDMFQAMRLAKIKLEQARQAFALSMPCKLKALDVAVGDSVGVTNSLLGISAKSFRVKSWELSEDVGVDLVGCEDAAAIYDWNLGAQTLTDLAPNSNLPSAFAPPALLGAITLSSGAGYNLLRSDGSVTVQAAASWPAVTDVSVLNGGQIEIQWQRITDPVWRQIPLMRGDQTAVLFSDVNKGMIIKARGRLINTIGTPSALWTYSAPHVVAGNSAVPPAPSALALEIVGASTRKFTITMNPVQANVSSFRLGFQSGATITWGSATVIPVPGISLGTTGASATYVWETDVPNGGGIWSFEVRSISDDGVVSSSGAKLENQRLIASGWPSTVMESICPDPYFLDPQWWQGIHGTWDNIGPGWFYEDAAPTNTAYTLGVRRSLNLWEGTYSGTGATFWESTPIPFSYVGVTVRLRAIGTNTANRILRVGCNFYNLALNSTLGNAQLSWAASGSYVGTAKSSQAVVPSGTSWVTFYVYMDAGAAFTGIAGASEVKLDFASDTGDIVPGAVSDTVENTITDGSTGGTFSSFVDDWTSFWSGGNNPISTISVTPTVDCNATVSINGTLRGSNTGGSVADVTSGCGVLIRLTSESTSPIPTSSYQNFIVPNVAASGTQDIGISFSRTLALTAGTAYTIEARLKKRITPGGDARNGAFYGCKFTMIARKR